jgi:hypothetical protein
MPNKAAFFKNSDNGKKGKSKKSDNGKKKRQNGKLKKIYK